MEKLSDQFNRDQLINEFNAMVADAEALLKSTVNAGDEKLTAVRSKAEQSLSLAKARLSQVQADVFLKAKVAARVAGSHVHDHPWQSIGIAAGIGLVVGILAGRR